MSAGIPYDRPIVVAGLGFGDEGKGATVDYLVRTRRPGLVVRYNGGPQTAHHVVTPEGITHCFSQFGSGTFVEGTRTLLTSSVLIDPPAIALEAAVLCAKGLADASARLYVEEDCPVITPYHIIMNRMQEEARGAARHGSCGRGVAQAWSDSHSRAGVCAREIVDEDILLRKLKFLRLSKIDLAEQRIRDARAYEGGAVLLPRLSGRLEELKAISAEASMKVMRKAMLGVGLKIATRADALELLRAHPNAVFEGAQGVLLDKDRGFFPHVTPSRTTFENGLTALLQAGLSGKPFRLGVVRAYMTRHGAGPLVTEDQSLGRLLPDLHNADDRWQGPVRCGWMDLPLLRYAASLCGGMDGLAVTCLDRIGSLPRLRICRSYQVDDAWSHLFDAATDQKYTTIKADLDPRHIRSGDLATALSNTRPELVDVNERELLTLAAEAVGAPVDLTAYAPGASGRREI